MLEEEIYTYYPKTTFVIEKPIFLEEDINTLMGLENELGRLG